MKSKTFQDAGNEHKTQWEPSEKGLRGCVSLCQVGFNWRMESKYYRLERLGEKSERNQHARVWLCPNYVAPWSPAKRWKWSRASACSNSGILSRLSNGTWMSAKAISTSGLATQSEVLHCVWVSNCLTALSQLLSEWRLRSNKLHELSNKSLAKPLKKTQLAKCSSAGLCWGGFFCCGSFGTESRHIKIGWYLAPQP